MKIGVSKDRKIFTSSSSLGTENENYYEVLEFTFPEELDNYIKYIEIYAEDEKSPLKYVDRIENNEFVISNQLSKYETLQIQIICKDLQKHVTYKSNIFTLTTNESLNILEDVLEEQEDLFERVERELQEVYQGMEEFKTEIVEDANSRFNTNVTEKTEGFNENAESKTNAFNSNYDEKLGTFNTNATSKLEEYNNNDTTKTEAYNTNATEKLSTYNQNATNKVAEYNTNAETKLGAYNTNATEKLAEYDSRVAELHEDLDETQTKVEQYNTNIDNKYTQYNTNAEQKLNAYNQNATTKTSEYNTNAQTKIEAYNTNSTAKMTAYNENAEEKVQEYNENASALMQSVDELEQKHDTEVAELNEKIAELETDLEMATDIIPTGDASGSDITLSDSARYYFKKMVLGGKSEQETFTGKNKLQVSATSQTINGIAYTINEDGTIKANGTATSQSQINIGTFNFEANTSYILSGCPAGGSTSTYRQIISGGSSEYGEGVNVSYTEDIEASIYIRIMSGVTVNNLVFKPMIRLASIADATFEKYVGGQPAPNPDYECPIQNVGDNINLNSSEMELGSLNDSGQKYYDAQTIRSKDYINIKGNTVYTINNDLNCNLFILFYDENYNYLLINNTQVIPKTFTSPANAKYIKVRTRQTENITDTSIKIKLEEGTEATPYSPYNCGNVEVKVENKNIFDTGNFTVSGNQNLDIKRDEEGSFIINGTNTSNTYINLYNIIPLNGDYTLFLYSNKTNSSAIYCNLYNSAESFATVNRIAYQGISNQQSRYLNFSSVEKCLSQRINIEAGTYSNFILKIMLVEGTYNLTNIGDYVPHEEQTVTFPLEEGQRLHKNDTIEDKIVQRRKTVVLNGTETINKETNSSAPLGFFFRLYLPLKAKYIDTTSAKDTMISSHFKVVDNNVRQWGSGCLTLSSTGLYIVFAITSAEDTVEKVQSWLAENLPELEYELAEPIETEFTEAQRTAKAQIDKLISYKGTTHITSEADLDVTYRKDLETMFDKMEELDARLSLLES